MTEQEAEKEEQQGEEKENKDILDKEIESWNNHFGYALHEENRILFNQMLSECLSDDEQYRNAVNSKGENYTGEPLFMSLIFQQQEKKMIKSMGFILIGEIPVFFLP
jgi:hypothetical protein